MKTYNISHVLRIIFPPKPESITCHAHVNVISNHDKLRGLWHMQQLLFLPSWSLRKSECLLIRSTEIDFARSLNIDADTIRNERAREAMTKGSLFEGP